MLVVKRNRKVQQFDMSKIERALKRIFKSCDHKVDDHQLKSIIGDLSIQDGMRTEDIQCQLEKILMRRGYHDEAKFFIIWRHIHYYDNYLGNKVRFMRDYLSSINPATGSKFDANANVTEKNLATLSGELFKGDVIKLNRYRLHAKIAELYDKETADEYLRMLENHWLYKHDESSIFPYCVSVSMYPFMLNGLRPLGGLSDPPKNIDSYIGSFCNLSYILSSQFAGAVATPEFLLYLDYFARKEWGQDYFSHANDRAARVRYDNQGKTILINVKSQLHQYFQQAVYTLNQPAAARSYQSIFWNIAYFDKYYFEGMFGEFKFPDGSVPSWESLSWLQKEFMKWLNLERTKQVITFPVESLSLLTENEDAKDKDYADFAAEMYSEGHSFFTYMSDDVDSLSSCCRLRNAVQENTFSFSLGMGGLMTGSKSVMTLNLNRLIQIAVREKKNYIEFLREQVRKVHKFQHAFNELLKEFYDMGALPVYTEGYINLNKQYLTIGINGALEAAEFLGLTPGPNKEYQEFCNSITEMISDENRKARTKELMFNTEFVPKRCGSLHGDMQQKKYEECWEARINGYQQVKSLVA